MKNLNYYLKNAKKKGQAIGHFNFATEDVLRAIIEGAKEGGAEAVMVGTSEGEADFVGMKEAVALVGAFRKDLNFPVFLNSDHFKSFEKCKEAIDAGYDSILIDPARNLSADRQQKGRISSGASGSKLFFDQNVEVTKRVVDYAHSVNPDTRPNGSSSGRISVEGELGYLRGSSEVQQKIEISQDDYTKPEEAADFVSKTGVDRLAIVFGNIHGIVTEQDEKLDIEHFKKIVAAVPDIFFVLHGASGLKDEDVSAAIKAGIVNVHFNTELRVAYHDSLEKTFKEKPEETTPYKYLGPAAEEVRKLVMAKTRIFTSR